MTEERERREGVVPPPAAQYVRTSPIRIRRSPMSNSHVQPAKAIAEDIAHLCCVPDDWRSQISNLAASPLPTFCAKPLGRESLDQRGAATVYFLLFTLMLFGFLVMATDFGRLYLFQ